jgi:AP-3 complex subunit beta
MFSRFADDVLWRRCAVSPDMEVKKLVYVYLVRYAEEEPDIALLSINSFQKDLKDPSQFIRASALRVMSSIRVDVIVPLIMLAGMTAFGIA